MTNKLRNLFISKASRWMLALLIIVSGISCTASRENRPVLRVLTYNIHHGQGRDGKFDYDRLADIILQLRPDLVALQEVDRMTERSSGIDQADLLAESTSMKAAFGRAMDFQGGEYGVALLSRFPLSEITSHSLPQLPDLEPRTALEARVHPYNGLPALTIVSTHLCHRSEDSRVRQVEKIQDLFKDREAGPVIIGGDLNARAGSRPMDLLLNNGWADATAPDSRIDYVLIRSGDPWKVVEVEVLDNRVASDHRPVLAVLEWTGNASLKK